ncbi:MAG: hypothetical protein U1A77_24460 [Pirellulales bacterium]
MILREVTLAARTIRQRSAKEAVESYMRMEWESECVCDMYRRVLARVDTVETAKVIVDVWDLDVPSTSTWVDPANINRLLSVTFSPWNLSFSQYWNEDEPGRRRLTLETLHGGLVWLARIEGWNIAPFEAARQECLNRNLVNEFSHHKTFPNPSRSLTIRLFCEFGMQEARVYADVKEGRKNRGRFFLGTAIPEAYTVAIVLNSLHWLDDSRFLLQLRYDQRGETVEFDVHSLLETTSGKD